METETMLTKLERAEYWVFEARNYTDDAEEREELERIRKTIEELKRKYS